MKYVMAFSLAAFLAAANAEDLAWPEDFDSKVAARETARSNAKSTASLSPASAVDARLCVLAEKTEMNSFRAEYLRLVESNATAFDSGATVGFLLFLK